MCSVDRVLSVWFPKGFVHQRASFRQFLFHFIVEKDLPTQGFSLLLYDTIAPCFKKRTCGNGCFRTDSTKSKCSSFLFQSLCDQTSYPFSLKIKCTVQSIQIAAVIAISESDNLIFLHSEISAVGKQGLQPNRLISTVGCPCA